MKKILFCAGLLALITSCTDDEYASLSHNENAKGITFEVIAPESPTTRGGLDIDEANNTYPYFWHAEVDKINIWSTRTNMGLSPSVSGKENWSLTGQFGQVWLNIKPHNRKLTVCLLEIMMRMF